MRLLRKAFIGVLVIGLLGASSLAREAGAQSFRPQKPVLHGKHWVAITGKPMAATAGATIFVQGGNAVDAACAMLAATSTMWDVLSWGGETQALIYQSQYRKGCWDQCPWGGSHRRDCRVLPIPGVPVSAGERSPGGGDPGNSRWPPGDAG